MYISMYYEKSLASIETVLMRTMQGASFFQVTSHKYLKVNNILLKIKTRLQCT